MSCCVFLRLITYPKDLASLLLQPQLLKIWTDSIVVKLSYWKDLENLFIKIEHRKVMFIEFINWNKMEGWRVQPPRSRGGVAGSWWSDMSALGSETLHLFLAITICTGLFSAARSVSPPLPMPSALESPTFCWEVKRYPWYLSHIEGQKFYS